MRVKGRTSTPLTDGQRKRLQMRGCEPAPYMTTPSEDIFAATCTPMQSEALETLPSVIQREPMPTYGFAASESTKKLAHQDEMKSIGDFLTWLQDHRKVVLCQYSYDADKQEEVLIPLERGINQWLADYFEIDLEKLEQERQQALQVLQSLPSFSLSEEVD